MATATRSGIVKVRLNSNGCGAARRGWGQGVKVGARMTWPNGRPTRGERYDDPIDDQLRHAIAWSPIGSHAIAARAGITPATIDRFMRGADALSLATAARVARIVGVRLIDQRIAEGFIEAAERGGEPIYVPRRNRLVRAGGRA